MAKLRYRFNNDILFKMLFVEHQNLLKSLVAAALGVTEDSIDNLDVVNPDIPPESLGDKFCRLDLNMAVDGQNVDLEIQVADEGNFRERSAYYCARLFVSALKAGEDYRDLPRAVLISILDFELFDCEALHSKFAFLEQSRQELLTDRMELHFFELPKIPKKIDMDDKMQLWLKVLDAQTEEELEELEKLEVSEVAQAVAAYRSITARDEFKELERLRAKARNDEAGALKNAERREREKWQRVVAEKEAAIADKEATIADKEATIADKEATIADKEATIADKEATIAELRAQLASNKK